jgi:NADH-quinone oxidoreductase subunit H
MMFDVVAGIVKILWVFLGLLLTAILMIVAERRLSAFMQDRLGPNRVGPQGLLQPFADVIKLLFKEDIVPDKAERFLFILSGALITIPSIITFAVIPFGDRLTIAGRAVPLQIADFNVGILYMIALSSLTVYGVVLGGWASRSTYPLLGGLRSSAQMISYEIPLGLSLIPVLMLAGSLRLPAIVGAQAHRLAIGLPAWNVFLQPVALIVFTISILAETNRLPFDLPETEQELVGGYHTEFSSMKFALFFLAEFFNIITASALIVTLFFGGWHVPGLSHLGLSPNATALIGALAFVVKTGLMLFFFVWVRWTFPRFRFDQLMGLGWKVLLPIALANIAVTGIVLAARG